MNRTQQEFSPSYTASKERCHFLCFSPLLLAAILASGCGSTKTGSLAPTGFSVAQRHAASVSVSVPLTTKSTIYGPGQWTSFILAGEYAEALKRTLRESGVFREVVNTPDVNYTLNVSFVNANETGALAKTVELVTKWILTQNATGEDVLRENISTTYTAKVGEAFDGGVRLRLANERVAQENIKEGIRRLSALKL